MERIEEEEEEAEEQVVPEMEPLLQKKGKPDENDSSDPLLVSSTL